MDSCGHVLESAGGWDVKPSPGPRLPPVGRPQQGPLPPPGREHQVEVVAHVLVEVCHKVVVVSKV